MISVIILLITGFHAKAADFGTGRMAKAISQGSHHSCAILDNDLIKCWGTNSSGQLGLGDIHDRALSGDSLPYVNLGLGHTARVVAVGEMHSCALLEDNSVKCWGDNSHNQLGRGPGPNVGGLPGEMGDALTPVSLRPGHVIKNIEVSGNETCATLDNSQKICWP